MWFYFPSTLSRLHNLCLNPIEKSHIPVCLRCVSGSCSEWANQKLQVHFITACCVCAWRRHVPPITETIWHQHYCMLPNLGISIATIPYRHGSWGSLRRKTSLRYSKLTLVINIWRSSFTDTLAWSLWGDFECYLMQHSWEKCWHTREALHQTRQKSNRQRSKRGRREGLKG